MKPVLTLIVAPDGSYGWQFAPECDAKTLPPFTLAAAVLQLQAITTAMLAQSARPIEPGIETAGVEVLNRINGKGKA
jgi:hypothetical protein